MTKVKTRFLILSDTHCALPYKSGPYAFREPLPKADVLLHCGDLSSDGQISQYERALELMGQIDAELKLVIAGNHDLSLDSGFKSTYRSPRMERALHLDATSMWKGEQAENAGVTYLEEGFRRFRLSNGASFSVYATPYTPEFCHWAFAYERKEDRYNLTSQTLPGVKSIATHPVPDFPAVDIMMTHGPPAKYLGMCDSGIDAGCESLKRAVFRCRPIIHAFGHIHEDWGAIRLNWKQGSSGSDESLLQSSMRLDIDKGEVIRERAAYVDLSSDGQHPLIKGESTLLCNASIMNLKYSPQQAPWLIDVDLPVGN